MKPSEVRERILGDHESLRELLDRLERLCKDVSDGHQNLVGPLRGAARTLLGTLRQHMKWEDRNLAPALEGADAWGPERTERLAHDHREQRQMLKQALLGLDEQQRPAPMLAASLLQLVEHIRADMEHEEHTLLDPNVLRDDVIGINVEAG